MRFSQAIEPDPSLKIAYITYLNAIGEKGESAIKAPLLAKNCRKIINGVVISKNKQEVEKQLKEVRETAGAWKVALLDDTLDPIKQKFTVHYNITSQSAGAFTVIAIVKYTPQGQIEEINEVYQPLPTQ